jgi:ribosomal protein S12 methylthiotransferase accessory factor
LRHGGVGTHVDPAIALERALTETAQSRAADIQGSREDLAYLRGKDPAPDGAELEQPSWEFSDPTSRVPFPRASVEHDDIRDDIAWMMQRLERAGLSRVLVVDLTRRELGVPVVRVLVPGLEQAGVDSYRVGQRVRRAVGGHTDLM